MSMDTTTAKEAQHEMDHPRKGQGRPRRMPMAHQEVRRQGCRVRVRARREGDGGGEAPRRHSLRRQGRRAWPSRQGMLVRGYPKKYKLTGDPALVLLGRIVNGADTDNTLYHQPEGPGLEAVAEGFRYLGFKDDHEHNAAEWIVYDALYAYCREMAKRGKPTATSLVDTRLSARAGYAIEITRAVDNRPISFAAKCCLLHYGDETCLAVALPAAQSTLSRQPHPLFLISGWILENPASRG